MIWAVIAVGVHSPHFTVISGIVIVSVTANLGFMCLISVFSSRQRKVQEKNE